MLPADSLSDCSVCTSLSYCKCCSIAIRTASKLMGFGWSQAEVHHAICTADCHAMYGRQSSMATSAACYIHWLAKQTLPCCLLSAYTDSLHLTAHCLRCSELLQTLQQLDWDSS